MKCVIILFVLCTFIAVASSRRNVCYWGTWAYYRRNPQGKFTVEDIDPTLCTHIVYSFMKPVEDGSVTHYDEWLDIGLKYISKFIAIRSKSPSTKLMYSIGGWSAGSHVFSTIASSPAKRANFAQSAVQFAKKFGFDGFDLDWEYPAQRDGSPSDKGNFILLLAELHRVCSQNGLVFSIAVAAASPSAQLSYNVPQVAANVDFVNLMTYDFHGTWDRTTGLNGAMFRGPHDTSPVQKEMNVDSSVQYWIRQGAPRDKLNVGIGAYGRSFTLANPGNNGVGAPANGGGNAGPFTGQAGVLGYNEICLDINRSHWTRVWEPTQMCPYTYNGNQWVGYDDVQSVRVKMDYINKNNLGGSMWWSIDTEDFSNLCGQGRYPLLRVAKSMMMDAEEDEKNVIEEFEEDDVERRRRRIIEKDEIDLTIKIKDIKYEYGK